MGNRLRRLLLGRASAPARVALVAGAIALLAEAARAQLTQGELHFLYEVNRARHDPAGWAAEQGLGSRTGGDGQPTTLVGVEPRPPLALNETLVESAGFKAEEMALPATIASTRARSARRRVSGRTSSCVTSAIRCPSRCRSRVEAGSTCSGTTPTASSRSRAGDDIGGGVLDYSRAIKAVAGLIVDAGVETLGHRQHLLATNEFNTIFTEAGPGYGFDPSSLLRNHWAFHTGVTDPSGQFLTGVAFDDADGDDLFDPGEGLAGVTVNVGAEQTLTNDAGGWSLPVADGAHAVSCLGGGFAGTASASVPVSGANRHVDCVSGFDGLYVDFVAVWEPPRMLSSMVAVLASPSSHGARVPRLRGAPRAAPPRAGAGSRRRTRRRSPPAASSPGRRRTASCGRCP